MATNKIGKKLETAPRKAFTRSPNGQGRVKFAVRFSMEELNALEVIAEESETTLSEVIREAVREKLTEEKVLVS
jgi:hypothetical protein